MIPGPRARRSVPPRAFLADAMDEGWKQPQKNFLNPSWIWRTVGPRRPLSELKPSVALQARKELRFGAKLATGVDHERRKWGPYEGPDPSSPNWSYTCRFSLSLKTYGGEGSWEIRVVGCRSHCNGGWVRINKTSTEFVSL